MKKSILDKGSIEIPCANCGHKTPKTVAWIRNNTQFTCVCGTAIHLDADQLESSIDRVNKLLGDFSKKLKR